jgi:uncharacterized protein (TIGR02145 family)
MKVKLRVLVFLFLSILGAAFALGTKESDGSGTTAITPVQQRRTQPQTQQPALQSGNKASAEGIYIDPRDGQVYRTVKIGNLTWLAENLKYVDEKLTNPSSRTHWAQVNSRAGSYVDNFEQYGRLYSWAAAKDAVPPGWRLPTRKDWDNLATVVGSTKTYYDHNVENLMYWKGAGLKLKSKTGWGTDRRFEEYITREPVLVNEYGSFYDGGGTDDFMFSAMPGGCGGGPGGDEFPGSTGQWWSADEFNNNYAYAVSLTKATDDFVEDTSGKTWVFSVRAVTENPPVFSGAPPPKDRSDLALTDFSVAKTTISRNEDFEVFFRFKNMMNWRSSSFYVTVEFLDTNGKRASNFGGVIDDLPAGAESNRRSITIDLYSLRYLNPGQYQIRINIQYYVNGVRTERPITQATVPNVPTSINVTVR